MPDLRKFRTDDSVSMEVRPHKAYSTGSFLFDAVTGIGGLPVGRILECYGPEASGKSTAFYQAIGVLQRRYGGVGLILDYENAFVPWYAQRVGIDTDPSKLLVEVPYSLEDGFELARKVTAECAEERTPLIVVFDSLAAMTPKAVLESTDPPSENNAAGMQRAKAIENFLRVCTGEVARSLAVWCIVNHERDVIQTGWVPPGQRASMGGQKNTPGGRAVKYLCSLRVQFTPTTKEKGQVVDPTTGELVEGIVAQKVRIHTSKNKLASPFRTVEAWIRFGAGFDNAYDLFEVGLARHKIAKQGNTYVFHDGGRAVGKAAAIGYLRSHPTVADELERKLRELMEAAWMEQLGINLNVGSTSTEEGTDGDG